MIQQLRQRHRIIWLILAVLLPAIFVAGLLVRKPVPANQQLPIFTQGAPR